MTTKTNKQGRISITNPGPVQANVTIRWHKQGGIHAEEKRVIYPRKTDSFYENKQNSGMYNFNFYRWAEIIADQPVLPTGKSVRFRMEKYKEGMAKKHSYRIDAIISDGL